MMFDVERVVHLMRCVLGAYAGKKEAVMCGRAAHDRPDHACRTIDHKTGSSARVVWGAFFGER